MADLKCLVCKKPLLDTPDNNHFAEIRRGYFKEDEDEAGDIAMERIKANVFVCTDCYMNDPDLCQFFNKIGMNIR